MAPRSVAADAANAPSKPTPSTPKSGAAGGKKKAWIPPVSYDEEPVPVMGQDYNGSFLGHGYPELPLIKRLDWLHVPLLTITPLIALYGLATVPLRWQTAVWSVFYYLVTGLGITAGYHRLFAHRCYSATTPLKVALLFMGAGAVEGSARWWSRGHRAHHRYVDTDKDPYAATKGFWHAHIGWMLVKQDKKQIGYADISDLNTDPWVSWQHTWYLPIALFMGFALPTLVAGLGWGDWAGGYFFAAVARLVFVHHSTFCVNSLAHWAGSATYTDGHTARNSIITALVTVGEGYHNFHHEFPNDYRNGVEWYQYDPTKWFIRAAAFLGLAYDLLRFPQNEIDKGVLQMEQKRLNGRKAKLFWGPDPDALPVITRDQFKAKVADGAKWVILDGFVLDVASFMDLHPGGMHLLKTEFGNDITEKFKGGYYKHSNAARNLQSTLRVARIQGYWT